MCGAGEVNIGGYRILRTLGKGGVGEVFEVLDAEGRHFALKVFSVDHGAKAFLQRRFRTEGRLLKTLFHPRLVRVHDSGVDAVTGRPYFVMDLVLDKNGHSMTLEDFRQTEKVTESLAERWYEDLCSALAYCHSCGVIHRDIKLNNVLIDAAGHAVLSDFGISRVLDQRFRDELQMTTTFVEGETTGTRPVMGTYWYLAPEVRAGSAATAASDWYALGVTFFRLLTGLWYEPGTNALDLLDLSDRHWRERIERLLSDDPNERVPGGSSLGKGKRRSWRWLTVLAGCAVVCSVCIELGVGGWKASPASGVSVSEGRLDLVVDASNRFEFCPCPAGTNGYHNLTVAVTRQYWLAATPVTRRQWFAARGEPLSAWAGGEDAPITYVSRDEVLDFCDRLNRRFSAQLPRGYEIRLPTVAEWRLAYVQGNTVPFHIENHESLRRTYDERGWFGQGVNGEAKLANMRCYYADLNRAVPLVTNIWPSFPPRVINPGNDDWQRSSSEVPPVPVGLKPANDFGLHDMLGNCFERLFDTCSDKAHHWGKTEWGVTTTGLYSGQGLTVTNPVERTGILPLMTGAYFAPDIAGDRVWSADFDRLPHLGFRLCIGPVIVFRQP